MEISRLNFKMNAVRLLIYQKPYDILTPAYACKPSQAFLRVVHPEVSYLLSAHKILLLVAVGRRWKDDL